MGGAGLRVLVAEDEALIRMDLVETLQELGFEVVASVGDGTSAVAAAERTTPHIALLDIKMPDMDGLAAASQIIALRSTAVVMLTAFSQPELIQRAIAAGAMGYLVKPFKPDELRAALTVAWERYSQLRDEQQRASQLEQSLADRKTIERARGVVQARLGVTEDEAYTWLRRTAMDERVPLVDVARRTLDATD
ncbi:MAG: response regulator [Actinobacteria bacterium]|nr:response regulator [Actinomycetota bacterium]MCB8995943.1 response regulator [Actinomycetota bacterium]MCB9424166.1 response regulator [Actinomycetota bacterium]HRY08883.1 response regulator [Candidatus Nanopelagicales bacterium]